MPIFAFFAHRMRLIVNAVPNFTWLILAAFATTIAALAFVGNLAWAQDACL